MYNNKKAILAIAFSALFLVFLLPKCSTQYSGQVQLPPQKKPFERLSQYGFFSGEMQALQPNDWVLPYDLITPLFSDYAEKARFIWMPEGKSAIYQTEEVLDFPDGTAIVKNFYYPHDFGEPAKGRRIIETRLLLRYADTWEALTYIWNDEQTEAFLDVVGDIKEVKWVNAKGISQKTDYIIPNKNQCQGCHEYDKKLLPIGPKVRNLNKSYPYADGIQNQLAKWTNVGYLTGYDAAENPPAIADWSNAQSGSLHERAMAYLDVNCGHCHNPQGPAYVSGLDLSIYSSGADLGIFKSPVSASKGSGGRPYSIVPGQPEQSILLYRMQSTDPGAMMPELGRRLVHQEGVELIEEWIAEMMEGEE